MAAPAEENFDDLDDILDEFVPATAAAPVVAPTKAAAQPSPSSSSNVPKPPAEPDLDTLNADFADEFARQMEAALRELGGESNGAASSSSAPSISGKESEQEEAFRKAWEKLLVDGMNGEDAGAPSSSNAPEDPFQKNIREAMERLKQSDDTLQANAADSGDDLEKLLASLGGENTDEGIHGILEGMMGQLMSKEVLYDPLKELHDKFPAYMKENGGKLSSKDKERYEAQITFINKIISVFDDPAYNDDDAEKSAEIVSLMSEMQTHGSPPDELMGPLPPGLNLGGDGMPKIPDECQTQ